MKATIKQTGDYTVTLTYDCPILGTRRTREFWIPRNDGTKYVREGNTQVCDGLGDRGNTLSVRDPAELLPLIRSQWKAWQAAERRMVDAW